MVTTVRPGVPALGTGQLTVPYKEIIDSLTQTCLQGWNKLASLEEVGES